MSNNSEIVRLGLTVDDLLEIGKNYQGKIPEPPVGYEITGYRAPKNNEMVLLLGQYGNSVPAFVVPGHKKYLLLKQKPDPGPRQIIPINHIVTVHASSVYGYEVVNIPEGYRFVEFRIPQIGDYYISVGTNGWPSEHPILHEGRAVIGPRIVVEKI